MAAEPELARLSMADGSDLVLTDRHLWRRDDRGWRGEGHVIIPRDAITSVSIEWHRNLGFIIGGAIVVLISLTLQFAPLPFSPPFPLVIAIAVLGVAIMLLSLIKSHTLQITAANASIEGAVSDYDAAQKFFHALLHGAMETAPPDENEKSEFSAEDRPDDSNWHL
jgi:hypothetical protein